MDNLLCDYVAGTYQDSSAVFLLQRHKMIGDNILKRD